MSMKKFLPIVLVAVLFAACNKPAGELVGIGSHANFSEANPYGMVYVKQGAFMMGADAQPTIFSVSDRSITVSVDAFWMDETEITNDEYKQFVYWVRDSIARTLLVEAGYDEYGIFTDDYYYEEEGEEMQIPLNWKRPVPWNSKDYDIMDILSQMNYEGENIINPALLRYRYEWINYDQAAMLANRLDITTGKYPPNAKVRVDSCWIDENGTICDTTIVRKLTRRRDFISNLMGYSVNNLPDYFIYKISECLQFLYSCDAGIDKFFIERLPDTRFHAPGHRLKGMTFEQFMHIDTMFNKYVRNNTDDNLNMFVAHVYIRHDECFVLPEDYKKHLFSIRKKQLLQPTKNAKIIAKRVDKHIKYAVFLNYILIKHWLSKSFPFLFPEDDKPSSSEKKSKIRIPSVKWLDIFDSFVGDDIAQMDKYRAMPATTAFRIMNRRIRESQKNKK